MPSPSQLNDYAFVNIAKKQLGILEDDYRAMLKNITGKTSLTKMDFSERYKVKQQLKKLGFKPTKGNKSKKRLSPVSRRRVTDVIRSIWISMAKDELIKDGSETALNHWVKRMTKKKYNNGLGLDSVSFLENAGADVYVLEILKKFDYRLRSV